MRVLLVAKRSARSQRIPTLNQLRHLVFTGPESIRSRFKDRYKTGLIAEAAGMRPRSGADPVLFTTNVVIRGLARRIQGLNDEIRIIDAVLRELVTEVAPSRLELYGVGVDAAAALLVTAGDNPDRLRSEGAWVYLCGVTPVPASSGKTIRYRLNRGGDRNANSALYRVVLTRMSSHQETRRMWPDAEPKGSPAWKRSAAQNDTSPAKSSKNSPEPPEIRVGSDPITG